MSAVWKVRRLLPVYPDKPTTEDAARTSHSGQEANFRINERTDARLCFE
ncbi:hypothetical protein GGD63_002836 [Bradyrhizobium sp. cir1]|nr:hypothetical protein [Bradyrhizobium sp. cir1]